MKRVLLLLRQRAAPARSWLVLLGYMASMVDLIPFCRLRMRPLQFPWRGYVFYAFPPPALIPRFFLKLEADLTLSLLLVGTFWPLQPDFGFRTWSDFWPQFRTDFPFRAFFFIRTNTGSIQIRRPCPWQFSPHQGVLRQGGVFAGSCPYGVTGTSPFHPGRLQWTTATLRRMVRRSCALSFWSFCRSNYRFSYVWKVKYY